MTHKKLTPAEKYEVLFLCTEYVKPEQIKKEFGITYDSLNKITKKNHIPKWQPSYSARRKQNEQEFLENEQYEKELRIRLAREFCERDVQEKD
jgi:hypothetical protein